MESCTGAVWYCNIGLQAGFKNFKESGDLTSCKPTSLEIISKPYLKCIIVISLYVIVFSAIFSFCMVEVIVFLYYDAVIMTPPII